MKLKTYTTKPMYKAEIVNGKIVLLKLGKLEEKGFNYLAEAQERADELNKGEKNDNQA